MGKGHICNRIFCLKSCLRQVYGLAGFWGSYKDFQSSFCIELAARVMVLLNKSWLC